MPDPLPEPDPSPEPDPAPEEESPIFADFSAIEFPGPNNWLVSGQIVGCEDPSNIGVDIGGAVSSSATTDDFGYFEVLVNYGGGIDEIAADANYNGEPIPSAYCQIGF